MRIKLTVCYDGTAYCGWQVQPTCQTVQQQLEEAVFLTTGERVRVTGSGRTDAGVHAEAQVAHFDTQSTIPPHKFYKALNIYLPADVKVIKSEQVAQTFHACNDAKKKTYRYSFFLSDVEIPLKERYSVMLDSRVNIEKMQKTASVFLGEHDFKAFCASGSGAKTTVRTIYNISVEKEQDNLFVTVTGNGFLYNMVRIMVGTLIMVAKGEMSESALQKMLDTGEREMNIKTLPAKGLCLMNVEY